MSIEFTERVRRVLGVAGALAAEQGAAAIEPEHLLAGLIIEGKGLISRLFAASRTSMENIARELAFDVNRHELRNRPLVDHPHSADVKRILELAADESAQLGHTYLGPEHLLLGILWATDVNVSRILRDKGLRHEDMRRHLTAFLAPQAEVRQNPSLSQSAPSEDGISLEWISTADQRPIGDLQDGPVRQIIFETAPDARQGQVPRVLREVKPQYSRSASERGVEGNVALEGLVLPDGSITAIRVVRSLDPELDELAIQALRQWQFSPATIDGRPVPSTMRVELTFSLR